MSIATVSQRSVCDLSQELRSAQASIHLPEVQEMLRRLSEYNLGIFMPHMHNARSGQFQPLPDELIQVESGLEVSFRQVDEIAIEAERFLPVAWRWRADGPMLAAACEMTEEEAAGNSARSVKHKMKVS